MFKVEHQKSSSRSSDLIPLMRSELSSDYKNKKNEKTSEGNALGVRDFSSVSILSRNNGSIQPKLKINSPGDKYEQEADRIADRVVSISDQSIQRKCSRCEEKEQIQTKTNGNSGMQVSNGLTNKISHSRGNGQALDSTTRSIMENRIGADFSRVRIHSGNRASEMSREINARAFTVGKDIYFDQGEYAPSSKEGKRLLAHELTHTIQQGSSQGIGIQKADGDKKKKLQFQKQK